MHTFDDDQGRTWQATLLEASWGNVYLVFGLLQQSSWHTAISLGFAAIMLTLSLALWMSIHDLRIRSSSSS